MDDEMMMMEVPGRLTALPVIRWLARERVDALPA
jgi:hypothetical protein